LVRPDIALQRTAATRLITLLITIVISSNQKGSVKPNIFLMVAEGVVGHNAQHQSDLEISISNDSDTQQPSISSPMGTTARKAVGLAAPPLPVAVFGLSGKSSCVAFAIYRLTIRFYF
jgi:hypothetical protein